MSVKRYDSQKFMAGMFVIAEKEDGKYVRHSDYAALEQQLAESHRALRAETTAHENTQMQLEKMAAENAGIKNSIPKLKDIDYGNDNMDDVSLAEDIGFNDAVTLMSRWMTETPATDYFLAEVRAQGVDAAIEHLLNKFEGTGHIGVPVMALEWLAQELRKGVQS